MSTGLLELLDERSGDDMTPAVHSGDREVTRAALRDAALRLAETLRSAGVQAGQPVAVMLPNGPEVVAALFGVWYAGGVYVPINPRVTAAELAHYLQATHPAALVTDGRVPSDLTLPVIAAGELSWALASATATATATAVPRHEADIALVQWTSGTTGRPKPVLLRHSGFLKLLEPVLQKLVGDGAQELVTRTAPMPNLIPTSMALSAGIYNVLFAFRVGAAVIVMPRFEPVEFAELVSRFQLRSTVLPPAAMTMLCDEPSVTSLAPLKYVRSISAPLSPLQARRFRDKFGISVLNCYGQTEIGGEIVGWNAADSRAYGDEKLGAVGRAHDGVELRIADSGELQVRTPAVTAGYADGGQLTDRLTNDGWFRTGDVGRIDAEGFLWIEGRISDMINRGGLKIFPGEVEEVLRLDPAVADVAVVGVPDDRLGEVPWAFVVLAPGATLDAAALTATAREQLAPFKIPVKTVAVAKLPRNEAGKVLHRELLGLV